MSEPVHPVKLFRNVGSKTRTIVVPPRFAN